MKILFLLVMIVLGINVHAQFRPPSPTEHYKFSPSIFTSTKKTFIPGLASDQIINTRVSPMMTSYSSWNWQAQNAFFWTGAVTSQSFNKGKFGTFYYWDVQGNLRGTRGFIDISGKNKRGFKLVFPWKIFR